jgi:hypothetical protein
MCRGKGGNARKRQAQNAGKKFHLSSSYRICAPSIHSAVIRRGAASRDIGCIVKSNATVDDVQQDGPVNELPG